MYARTRSLEPVVVSEVHKRMALNSFVDNKKPDPLNIVGARSTPSHNTRVGPSNSYGNGNDDYDYYDKNKQAEQNGNRHHHRHHHHHHHHHQPPSNNTKLWRKPSYRGKKTLFSSREQIRRGRQKLRKQDEDRILEERMLERHRRCQQQEEEGLQQEEWNQHVRNLEGKEATAPAVHGEMTRTITPQNCRPHRAAAAAAMPTSAGSAGRRHDYNAESGRSSPSGKRHGSCTPPPRRLYHLLHEEEEWLHHDNGEEIRRTPSQLKYREDGRSSPSRPADSESRSSYSYGHQHHRRNQASQPREHCLSPPHIKTVSVADSNIYYSRRDSGERGRSRSPTKGRARSRSTSRRRHPHHDDDETGVRERLPSLPPTKTERGSRSRERQEERHYQVGQQGRSLPRRLEKGISASTSRRMGHEERKRSPSPPLRFVPQPDGTIQKKERNKKKKTKSSAPRSSSRGRRKGSYDNKTRRTSNDDATTTSSIATSTGFLGSFQLMAEDLVTGIYKLADYLMNTSSNLVEKDDDNDTESTSDEGSLSSSDDDNGTK